MITIESLAYTFSFIAIVFIFLYFYEYDKNKKLEIALELSKKNNSIVIPNNKPQEKENIISEVNDFIISKQNDEGSYLIPDIKTDANTEEMQFDKKIKLAAVFVTLLIAFFIVAFIILGYYEL